MRQVAIIEHISISAGWEHEQAILVFNNRGQDRKYIDIRYQKLGKLNHSLKHFQLLAGVSRTVKLPKGFEKYEKFYFRIGKKEWPNSIDDLRKLLDEAKAPAAIEQPRLVNAPPSPEPEPLSDAPLDSLKTGINETGGLKAEAVAIVRKTRAQVLALARAYYEGQPIELGEMETATPSQRVLQFLNLMARALGTWKAELERLGESNPNVIETLTCRREDITARLSAIRGESPPSPPPLSVEIECITDAELDDIRNTCAVYVARFEGMLIGYEQGREVDSAEYDAFIPRFITDRLFNSVARCMPFEALSERMDKFLHLVGYEIVPIEVGYTKSDSRAHEIQGSRQTGEEPGTIVEVVLPGLQRIADGTIVQKPVVIRGE